MLVNRADCFDWLLVSSCDLIFLLLEAGIIKKIDFFNHPVLKFVAFSKIALLFTIFRTNSNK